MSAPPIGPGGWLAMDRETRRVVDLGPGASPEPARTKPLGDAAILPGLINAHTHLEFSDLAAPIGTPGISLAKWIGQVVASRAGRSPVQTLQAMLKGIAESENGGVVHVVDIATPPTAIVGKETVGVTNLFEVVGLDGERYRSRLDAALGSVESDPESGLSPHAPYSLRGESIREIIDAASLRGRMVAMHLAESPDERDLLFGGGGPFAESLGALGIDVASAFPRPEADYQTLIEQLAAAPSALLIHGNDLNEQEIQRIAAWPQLSVVYCPRTHHFFQHKKHPIDRLWRAGVRVLLGTDSKASNPDLSVWSELGHLWKHRPDLDPMKVLAAATLDAADVLGISDKGRIAPGSSGRLLWLRSTATDVAGLAEDLMLCQQPVFLPE